MQLILMILAIFGLSHFIRNLSGPFNIFGRIRNGLMKLPLVGVFFYELLSCPFCIGTWCGLFVYLLSGFPLILWGLAGASIVALLDALYNKLMSS